MQYEYLQRQYLYGFILTAWDEMGSLLLCREVLWCSGSSWLKDWGDQGSNPQSQSELGLVALRTVQDKTPSSLQTNFPVMQSLGNERITLHCSSHSSTALKCSCFQQPNSAMEFGLHNSFHNMAVFKKTVSALAANPISMTEMNNLENIYLSSNLVFVSIRLLLAGCSLTNTELF